MLLVQVHTAVCHRDVPASDHAHCYLVQAALPCLLAVPDKARSELTLRGGTDAAFAPPVWFTQHVTLPLLRAWWSGWGLDADLQVLALSGQGTSYAEQEALQPHCLAQLACSF